MRDTSSTNVLRRRVGRRRDRAHASGVGAAIAVEDALVVARGNQGAHVASVAEPEHAHLRAAEQFLDDDLPSGIAEAQLAEALVECALRLLDAAADDHALAEREPVGLDHARSAELGDERAEPRAIRGVAGTQRAVGIPAASITCFANVLDDSMRAAAAVGPKTSTPRALHASATPAAAAASGPMMTRSTARSEASRATAVASVTSTATFSAMSRCRRCRARR